MSESLPQSRLSVRIVTEEELKQIETLFAYDDRMFLSVIASHRELSKANTELRTDRDIALQAADNAIKQTVVLSDRVTELEEIIEFSISTMIGNELFVKAGQVRRMLEGAKNNAKPHNPL
jgi:hypothetical protein